MQSAVINLLLEDGDGAAGVAFGSQTEGCAGVSVQSYSAA